MKTIQIEIPEGKNAEWVDGVLTLVDDKPIDDKPIVYKFNVGDKVVVDNKTYKITDAIAQCGKPAYRLEGLVGIVYEGQINGYTPKPITERIKTFDDAYKWCEENGKENLVDVYNETCWRFYDMADVKDLLAYLKLRIITAALNEGWEPTKEDFRYVSYYSKRSSQIYTCNFDDYYCDASTKLCFKSKKLALYAAKQFRDIYADFCGCKKGGEA